MSRWIVLYSTGQSLVEEKLILAAPDESEAVSIDGDEIHGSSNRTRIKL